MKKGLLTSVFSFIVIFSFAQLPNFQWVAQIGGSSVDEGRAVATDAFGNVYAIGEFNGTVDFDPGPGIFTLTTIANSDIFVSKLDASGNFVWAKKLGNISLSDEGNAITIDASGNVYTTGYFGGTADFDPGPGTFNLISSSGIDIFISKLDASGNFVWAKNVGGSFSGNDIGRSIATDPSGNVYITGNFSGQGDFDPGPGTFTLSAPTSNSNEDIFVLKLDALGNFVWAKNMGGTAIDYGFSIAADAAGNVYTAGLFGQTADFDPGLGTYTLSTITGNFEVFVSKLDISGNFVWAKQVSTSSSSTDKCALTIDASSNIYITGLFIGTVDFDPGPTSYTMTSIGNTNIFVFKIDAAGNFAWAKEMGGISADGGTAIALDASSNVYSTGYFSGTADFDPGAASFSLTSAGSNDIFISKFDVSGNFVWAGRIGSANYDYPTSIDVDGTGNIYSTGFYTGICDFDPGAGVFNLTDNGASDVFIHKMHQQPVTEKEINAQELINVYPIPTSSVIKLSKYTFSENSFVNLYNLIGEKVMESKSEEINLSDLKNGIYFLQLFENEKLITTKKIIKE